MEQYLRRLRAMKVTAMVVLGVVVIQSAHAATEPMATEHLLRVTLGLLVVLAVMAALAWGLRRGTRLRMAAGADLETLGALSLGASERVVLIRAGGKHLLLGVAPGSVRTLHVLEAASVSKDQTQTSTPPQGFAGRLAAARAGARTP